MFVALRSGLAAKLSISTASKELCKVIPKNKYQVANLMRAAYRNEDEIPLIKPFPYHEKEYTVMRMLFDTNKCRVHDHSKIIVLDGPPAVGKHKLAKDLAKEFDFLYLPQPTFDWMYTTHWGTDLRQFDHKLPVNLQSWDIERWLHDPANLNTGSMQVYMYTMRQKRWMNILAHVLCTGQGVVTVRTPWSDAVFAKTMAQNKHISPLMYEFMTDIYAASVWHYLKPHVVVYLDAPVNVIQQNIKKRGLAHEKNNKALTDKYLTDLEENYKREYLAKISEHAHLLIYDWSQGGDSEVVLEDIEDLEFDFPYKSPKMKDWRFEPLQHKVYIKNYTYEADILLKNQEIGRFDVPEMIAQAEEVKAWFEVMEEVDDLKYAPGYNPLKGDTNILMNDKFMICEDYVTPLMQKYNERKQKLKSR